MRTAACKKPTTAANEARNVAIAKELALWCIEGWLQILLRISAGTLARCLAFEAHAPPVSPSAAVLTANTMQQDEKVKKAFFHCAPQQVAIADTAYSQDNAAADLYLPIHSSICSTPNRSRGSMDDECGSSSAACMSSGPSGSKQMG